jgi:hypothetical protein
MSIVTYIIYIPYLFSSSSVTRLNTSHIEYDGNGKVHQRLPALVIMQHKRRYNRPMAVDLHPKSAMDIRQTRSSIVKIADCRRKIWERRRPEYEEKLYSIRKSRSLTDNALLLNRGMHTYTRTHVYESHS